ncbi:WD and tetratricopeptide repeats protein 1 [Dioscorea alata]|uniref:WD and tetratricopeptide repeats protein 1 n=4 Tax=Dioscorea alata TaxID=55571 RepID=A0ACB7U305_DIOAL|nr:WD and tetratricopeptide repeats protein 1 [Dioscorea alata]KAH7654665.1 WD and tetratricopeptide repeats protein 1 [Dioscorea alata]KAH7654666.1 WD and tetratricopeptide repeats protein 1 [Dioscorea alata]KAH7654669.1 WD and tetratricopeptide repeats protein 1 [Dioscorea alata]
MERWSYADGNIARILDNRRTDPARDINLKLQMHSSFIQRLTLKKEMEGHQGCVNALAWNSKGSLLISGSDDTCLNIWSYTNGDLVQSIDTGHNANIFCTKFVPETSDELVVSGAADAEVRLFNLSRMIGDAVEPSGVFQCHSRRVKKLAVEVGNPNVVWSASEDGTLRQYDFREGASCPPVGSTNQECRHVLLDLRCGAKKSLADPPGHCLHLKSCDISSTRPHQILVGGSDAFGRLYDRRMLPPLSSSQTNMKLPPCVTYFCPVHLAERRRSSLNLTHVTFSPNGEEVLLSYSGEHVYLMDVVCGGDLYSVRYRADDVPKRMYFRPSKETEIPSCSQKVFLEHFTQSTDLVGRHASYEQLFQAAKRCLEEDSNFLYGIEACNEVLEGKGPKVACALILRTLCLRASLLLKRKWKNDVYMAMRDCCKAHSINASSFEAHFYMSEALLQLGKHKEALDYAMAANHIDPSNSEARERIQKIRAELEKDRKDNEGTDMTEFRNGRMRSLSEVLLRSELISDASQEALQYEREDSDFDDEMELDFETSILGDEDHDNESNMLHGSLNLRFHRAENWTRGTCSTNGPSSSSKNGYDYQPEVAIDMKQRYIGHCNIGTDIKQASFLGQLGEYVASGSDDGRWFIWEKRTGRLMKMLEGDRAVVNCVQCHPFDCAVATSGIDNTIKMWTPHGQVSTMVAGVAGPVTADVLSAIEINQRKLRRSRETILPLQFFEQFPVHEFAEGTFHPFECAQS